MIFRNARLILATDLIILLCSVVTSLVGARALGPPGRGDLLIITLWPLIVSLLVEMGLPNSYRYWMAKTPERASALVSNAVIYTVVVGAFSIVLSYFVVPHFITQPSVGIVLVRLYLLNIPAVIFLDLMRGLLEGARRFGWAGAARLIFFGFQASSFFCLWYVNRLTVATAAYTMMLAQVISMALASFAVWRSLRPRWAPSWVEFRNSMDYGLRDYAGGLADYATLRLDQIMLSTMASNGAIGLYVMAVRLSEVTTFAGAALADALMPEVASSSGTDRAESLLGRTLRLTVYFNVLILIPIWLAAPLLLKTLFGESFVPATRAFRWLLIAAVVWSASAVVTRGLQGFGYPGLTTIARFLSVVATVPALLILLPRMGIEGAAIASLIGYSTMLAAALFGLIHRRQIGFWHYLRPQMRDIDYARLKAAAAFSMLSSNEG
jgi:O-antigen/teichoic acid export membrane protein